MIGQQLGQYTIEAEIGKGGMGTVYRARQLSLDRDVAIKVLSSEQALSATSLERFKREGASVAKVAHPNIVQVLDVGSEEGHHYIVMEFVEGRTVSKTLKEDGRFTFREAVFVCSQIASALGVMHEKGLIHRDIKPSNILVGKRQFAKLADFGVAGLAEEVGGERLTLTRTAVGTPYYMSPEQVKARVALDGSSDVYSLGVVLYEMLSGEHPFGDVTPTEAMMQQVNDSFPPIRRFRQNIPDDLERVLERCLSKDRAERYPNGLALHADLEKVYVRLGSRAEDDEEEGDYKSRMTGTSFFYVDPTETDNAMPGRVKSVIREAVSQLTDPHRSQRRRAGRLYRESMVARDRYKQVEKQWEELKKRLGYHEQKATGHRATGARLIADGKADEAGAEAEKESHHQKLGLDYRMQVDESGNHVGELRTEYDRSRQEHSESADELALLDAGARRRGQWIPYGRENPKQVHQALWLRRIIGGVATLCFVVGLLSWVLMPRRTDEVVRIPERREPMPQVLPVTSGRQTAIDPLLPKEVATGPKDGKDRWIDLGNGVHLDLVWVPSGRFVMGTPQDESGRSDDEVQHEVTLTKGFWIGKYEVTQSQWAQVMGNNPSGFSGVGGWGPVDTIDWRDSHAFVAKVNMSNPAWRKGKPENQMRLPTEAEWEYACRAGSSGPFAGSGNIDTMAWYSGNSGSTSHEVGMKQPNAWGIYDMQGNVWEWCEEGHAPYTSGSAIDPIGPEAGENRALRGGAWNNAPSTMRSGRRLGSSVQNRNSDVGLRVVISAVAASSVANAKEDAKPSKGLILHYSFDEGSGSVAHDASGHGYDGTVVGAKWNDGGRMGGCMDFSGGESARVEVNLNEALYGKRAATVAAWVKSKGDPASWEAVLGSAHDFPGTINVPLLFLWLNNRSMGNNAESYIWIHNDNGGDETLKLDFTKTVDEFHDGQWHHVVLTWDGSTMKHYVEGMLDSSIATPSGYLQTNRIQHIGGHRSDLTWANFNGFIDELRVYDQALTEAEIAVLRSEGGKEHAKSLNIPQTFDESGEERTSIVGSDRAIHLWVSHDGNDTALPSNETCVGPLSSLVF